MTGCQGWVLMGRRALTPSFTETCTQSISCPWMWLPAPLQHQGSSLICWDCAVWAEWDRINSKTTITARAVSCQCSLVGGVAAAAQLSVLTQPHLQKDWVWFSKLRAQAGWSWAVCEGFIRHLALENAVFQWDWEKKVSLSCKPFFNLLLSHSQTEWEARIVKMFTKMSSGKYNLNNFKYHALIWAFSKKLLEFVTEK